MTQRQLATILTEVEAVINTRPLVYVDEDINSSIILTPMNFLSLHSNHIIPDLTEDNDPECDLMKKGSAEQLLQTWKRGQKHLNQFWIMWRNEYLLSLRERTQLFLKGPHSTTATVPEVGDVVLIKENLPRGRWKVGRISELIPSSDKQIRSAKVVVTPHKVLKRALNLLYPIECPRDRNNTDFDLKQNVRDNQISSEEIDSDSEMFTEQDDNDLPENQQDLVQDTRPTRKAMMKARQRLKQWLSLDSDKPSLGSVADHVN